MATTAGGTYYAASSELVSSWPATSLDLANQLESRFASKLTTPGAWTSFTPTLAQGATNNISKTVNYAKYTQIGKLVVCTISVTASGTGTAANNVTLSLPIAASGSAPLRIGSGHVYDASTIVRYTGMAELMTATTVTIVGDWSGGSGWGTSPNIAVAASDQFDVTITYEVA